MKENKIADIHCRNCRAPAEFDIVRQEYLCGYCGGRVEISEALREKQGFRSVQSEKLRNEVKKYHLFRASCSKCGADILFHDNEALATCAFCGHPLVREEYLHSDAMPECVIPFRLTKEEAADRLNEWCQKNAGMREAKMLQKTNPELNGFYLPYELIRGPVHMKAGRMDGGRSYSCEGFVDYEFVNRSGQLDNLLLDGMEPYDVSELTEFDFAYVAGHCVKTSDIKVDEMKRRAEKEAEKAYSPPVEKVFGTKAIKINADLSSAMQLPVLLPVYYVCSGNLMAAVNGQTGKVSVRALKDSHHIFLPWWLKAILATLALCCISLAAFALFGMGLSAGLLLTGILGVFFIIVTLCVYSDTTKNRFLVESGRKIFTSGEQTFRRENGYLVPDERIPDYRVRDPVFFSRIEGQDKPVILKFATPLRLFKMLTLAFVIMFLPVICALFLNGFRVGGLHLEGSAVWFCIAVPVVPIYLLKFGIVELYENPWIYTIEENGRKRRYRKWPKADDIKSALLSALMVIFIPPVSIAVWLGIISFCVMCYLTAFG